MSRKGLSLDEKRKRIEHIFHETGEFYQLKDIEKIGSKKGVVLQSIKDVLMSLVDDGLVMTDKIGTSNYFWSYPSAAIETKRNKLSDLSERVDKETERKEQLERSIEEAREDREETEEREQLLVELKEHQKLSKELKAELQKYKDNDPALYEAKEIAIKVAKEAVNRWTENIWEVESYCVNKFGMERKVFDQTFDIDDNFDTI
ncbi:MAG: meiotic nuclear division protein 1 [Benjaminiella poitrasii]|nr:MAG: meiotic nuclear division protein 1 [Benjaminiella poitrasii]